MIEILALGGKTTISTRAATVAVVKLVTVEGHAGVDVVGGEGGVGQELLKDVNGPKHLRPERPRAKGWTTYTASLLS
jgi:hypothetical protein